MIFRIIIYYLFIEKMINPFFTKKFLFSIFIIQNIFIFSDYIAIPFKTHPYNQKNIFYFQNRYIKNSIYFPIQIGQPPQEVIGQINSLDYELLMLNENETILSNISSNFTEGNSQTFQRISTEEIKYFPDSIYVKDNFRFCKDYSVEQKKCSAYKTFNDINFIFTEWDKTKNGYDDKNKYRYLEIGMSIKSQYPSNELKSLFDNLVNNNYIDNKKWFIYFFNKTKEIDVSEKNNKDDEGIIVLGKDPKEFFGNKLLIDKVTSCEGLHTGFDYRKTWSLVFQEVRQKTLKKDNRDVIIGNNLQGVINFNYKVIVGTEQYMNIIERTFFFNYEPGKVCMKKTINNKFYYFVCSASLPFKKIKENFPTLYFQNNELGYTFELTAEDLFVQIGVEIYFLVVFNKNNPSSSFLLGNVFLEKYFFSFDSKDAKLFFYQPKKDDDIILPTPWYKSYIFYIVVGVAVLVFCGVGFYFGKKIYEQRKKKANELDDGFVYQSTDGTTEDLGINSKQSKANDV